MNTRRTAVTIASWAGFLLLVVLHVDWWRPQRAEPWFGWMPEELAWRLGWMALATVALTVLWVFTVDLVALSPALRVLSFLVLGVALMVISMVYSRRKARAGLEEGRPGVTSPPGGG